MQPSYVCAKLVAVSAGPDAAISDNISRPLRAHASNAAVRGAWPVHSPANRSSIAAQLSHGHLPCCSLPAAFTGVQHSSSCTTDGACPTHWQSLADGLPAQPLLGQPLLQSAQPLSSPPWWKGCRAALGCCGCCALRSAAWHLKLAGKRLGVMPCLLTEPQSRKKSHSHDPGAHWFRQQ